MKRSMYFLFFMAVSGAAHLEAGDMYKQELATFKQSSEGKYILNKNIDASLRVLNRDIVNYSELSYFQRFLRGSFLALDVVVVTAQTMPRLYAYVHEMCKEHNIAIPTIFITTKKSVFNAAALKLFTSSGGVVICQKMLLESSDAELEAVVAHEIGHIKYNHDNKKLFLTVSNVIAAQLMISHLIKKGYLEGVFQYLAASYLSLYIPNLIINKGFENEADAFACNEMHKAPGLIEYLEHLEANDLTQEQYYNDAVAHTQKAFQEARLSMLNSVLFKFDFWWIKLHHNMMNSYKWMYYNTFIGEHPSHEVRIAAAKKYLENI